MTRRRFVQELKKVFRDSQEAAIRYLTEELRFVMAHLGKRPRPSEGEKAALARAAKAVDPVYLERTFNLFTPATLMRWYRELVRKKWDYSRLNKKPGRPRVNLELEELVVKLALGNPSDGYESIAARLKVLGFETNPGTVRNILERNGILPSPRRREGLTWKDFLELNWEQLVATDFLTWEVLTPWAEATSRGPRFGCAGSIKEPAPFGLVSHYILFFIRLKDRKVHIAGVTQHPNETWMRQIARNITSPGTGFLKEGALLLHDRDEKYTAHFDQVLNDFGVRTLKLPPESPNLNAYAERWVRSVKEQCLSRMMITSEKQLRKALGEYVEYYNHERCHQGLGNRIPLPRMEDRVGAKDGKIRKKQRLGGLLNFYFREEIEPKPKQGIEESAA